MKCVLFPTDFSPHSDHALSYALHMAERLQLPLQLFHVYHYASNSGLFLSGELIDDAKFLQKEAAEAEMESYLEQLQSVAKATTQISCVLRQGFPLEELLAYLEETEVELIVMGTRGRDNARQRWLGSVTSGLIEKAPCPVFAIPLTSSFQEIKTIVYATNFEETSLQLPTRLIHWAKQLGAKVYVVHVVSQKENPWARLELFFHEELMRLEVSREHVELFVLDHPDVLEGLEKFILENQGDALAMYTHRHDFIERLFKKRITQEALYRSQTPLLVFHQDDEHPTSQDLPASAHQDQA